MLDWDERVSCNLVSRGHTLLKNRSGQHFRSLLQNLEEHTFTVLLIGRVRLDNERTWAGS